MTVVFDPVAQRLAEVGLEFGHGLAIDLSRITAALDALGRPQDRLPPVLHVAGTNGKGSTCAFLRAIAEAAGLRAHVFTSPHLIHARERVRVAGALADDDTLIAALDEVAACGVAVTYFEAITAAAFLLFSRTPAEVVILEVGLGGLHDATNVIAAPAVTVITPVDLDHQHMLGDTISDIAVQKAGILKPGCVGVIGRQAPAAQDSIERVAADVGALLWRHGDAFDAFATPTGFALQTPDRFYDLPKPALLGPHQIDNAGLACAAMLAWGDPRITSDALAAGVASAVWPGRMQPLTKGELGARAFTAGVALFVDGAHNPHGAAALAATLRTMPAADTVLIASMFANKDAGAGFAALRGAAQRVFTVPIDGVRAAFTPEALADAARAQGFIAEPAPDIDAALDRAFASVGRGGRIVVFGSLHLAGAVIAHAGGIH